MKIFVHILEKKTRDHIQEKHANIINVKLNKRVAACEILNNYFATKVITFVDYGLDYLITAPKSVIFQVWMLVMTEN